MKAGEHVPLAKAGVGFGSRDDLDQAILPPDLQRVRDVVEDL